MATVSNAGTLTLGDTIAALVAADGSQAAHWAQQLARPGALLRDLADMVHAICALHGTVPSIIEQASDGAGVPAFDRWLRPVATAFAEERRMLAVLTAAVGPLPSTPGQAQSEAAVTAQRHALAMLAKSDRTGCAIGAIGAFLIDWDAIRPLLDRAALRAGITATPSILPGAAATRIMLAMLDAPAAAQRAVVFGAQQLIAQHRGLWHLLDARASARSSL